MKKMLAVCCALGGLLSQELQAGGSIKLSVAREIAFANYEAGVREGIAVVLDKTGKVDDLSLEQKIVYLKDQFKGVVAKAGERCIGDFGGVISAAEANNRGSADLFYAGGAYWDRIANAAALAANNNFGGFTQGCLEYLNLMSIFAGLDSKDIGGAYQALLQGYAKGLLNDKVATNGNLANVGGRARPQSNEFNEVDFQVGDGDFSSLKAELLGIADDQKVEAVVDFFEKVAANNWRYKDGEGNVQKLSYMNSVVLFCQLMGLLPKEGITYTANGETKDADRPFLVEYVQNASNKLAYKYELSTEIKSRILSVGINLLAYNASIER